MTLPKIVMRIPLNSAALAVARLGSGLLISLTVGTGSNHSRVITSDVAFWPVFVFVRRMVSSIMSFVKFQPAYT